MALTLGFSAGAGMLFLPVLGVERELWWLKHNQFHGQAQLFGFAGLFTMGVAFHVVPRFVRAMPPFPVPQRAALTLILAGVFLRSFGQAMSHRSVGPYMLTLSGITLMLGALVFAGAIFLILRRGAGPRTPVGLWVAAGAIWAMVAAGIHLAAMIEMASDEADLVRGDWELAFIYAALFGFITNIIMAVSTRAVVGFLNLKPGYMGLRYVSFGLVNAGVAVFVVAMLGSSGAEATGVGQILVAIGLISFAASLRIFETPIKKRLYVPPAYGRYEWFVRAGYGWLVVGAILLALQGVGRIADESILPALLAAPIVHVFALGFVSMMIFGMSARMVPLFEPTALPNHHLVDAAFVLLNVSVALRLGFGLGDRAGSDVMLAISGSAGLAALICYSIPMFIAMRPAARGKYEAMMADLGSERIHQIQTYRASKLPPS